MYQKSFSGWLKHVDFMLIDFFCMQLAFWISFYIRNSYSIIGLNHYIELSIILTFIFIVVVFFNESFSGILRRGYYKEFAATVGHIALIMFVLVAYLFLTKKGIVFSRIVISLMVIIYGILSYTTRIIWKKHLKIRSSKLANNRSMILVTNSNLAEDFIINFNAHNFEKNKFSGIVIIDNDEVDNKIFEIPIVANANTFEEYLRNNWVDEVFVNLPNFQENKSIEDIYSVCALMGTTVHIKIYDIFNSRKNQIVNRIGGYTVLSSSVKVVEPSSMFAKRSLDILGGVIGCIFTLIIAFIIGPIIYFRSPGPIFYSQNRVGKNGKIFKMYKFRSMVMNADEMKHQLEAQNKIKDGLMFKIENDPRIISGIGQFIRKTSLDEFPQFFNVLKGEMSIVGTRPPTIDEWKKYELHHHKRLSIKPGVTGLWQVSGRSNIVNFEDVVKLDLEYIDNWNLGKDIEIIVKTIKVAFAQDGSA